LQERIFTKIISILNEDQRVELAKITDQNQWVNGKVYEYLATQISNYESFMEKTYQEFEDMYLKEYKHFSKK
jgi:D-ribose pyranose/furanose isomerase RbsD